MPQDMQSILNQATGTFQPVTSGAGVDAVSEPASSFRPVTTADVGVAGTGPTPVNFMAMVANRQQGRKPESELENDLNTLQPFEFKSKYGEAADGILLKLMDAEGTYNNYMSQNRSIPQAVWDGFTGVTGGVASGAVGLAGLGVGLVDPITGARIAKAANSINTFTEDHQSDPLAAHRLAGEARGAYQAQADAEAYKSDLESGTNHLVAKLSDYGRQVIHSVRNAATDPMLLEQGTVDNAGAIAINYALTAGLGAVAEAVAPATRVAAVLDRAATVGAETAAATAKGAALTEEEAGAAYARAIATGERLSSTRDLLTKTLPPMASQGIQMGGMAYQQAVGEVLNKPFDDLQKTSQVYRDAYDQAKLRGLSDADAQEEARTHTAGIAGRQAALIAAPLAAATTHISHISQHPFAVGSVAGSVAEILKQGAEGGLVNASQTLAENIANKNVVDPNTELDANLAHAAGEGALYGLTAAASMQAPGLAVEGTKLVAGSAIKGTVDMLSHVFGGSSKAVIDGENAKTTVSPEKLKAATTNVIAAAPQVSEEVHQQVTEMDIPDLIKKNITDYVDGFHEAVLFDPSKEITNPRVPAYITDPLEGVTDRIEAINNLASATYDEQDPAKKNQLASVLYDVMAPLEQFRHAGENVLDLLPTDTPIREMIERYQKLAGAADQLASVHKAEEGLKAHFTNRDPNSVQPLTASEIDTPTGNTKIDDVITNARVSPETGNIKAIDSVLAHAEAGHINLTPDQRSALLGSRTILEARQQFIDSKKVNGVIPSDATRVSDEILTGKFADKATQTPSATQFFNEIYRAVRSGDLVKAKNELSDMGLFVQHLKNKAEAVNTHTANPDQFPKGVPYTALAPRSVANEDANGVRHWYTSTSNVKGTDPFIKPTSAGSVQFAHDVFNDHTALTHVYNGLTDAFPQLGESKIAPAQIHPALAGDTTAKVAQQFEAGTRKVSDFAAAHAAQQEAIQKQQAAFDRKAPAESIVAKNLPEAQKPVPQTKVEVPAVPEVVPEPTATTETPVTAPVEAPTPEAAVPEAPSTPVEAPAPVVTPTAEPAAETAAVTPVTPEIKAPEAISTPEVAPVSGDALGSDLPGYLNPVGSSEAKDPSLTPNEHIEARKGLVQTVKNMFYAALGLRNSDTGIHPTRVLESFSPVDDIRKATASPTAFKAFVGDAAASLKRTLTNETADAYQKFLTSWSAETHSDLWSRDLTKNPQPSTNDQNARWMNFGGLVMALHKNLNSFLERTYPGTERTMADLLLTGDTITKKNGEQTSTVNRFSNGKVLNLVEPYKGSFAYNQNLLETAAMAGMHWYLTVGHGRPLVTEDAMERITGLSYEDIPDEVRDLLKGTYSIQDVKGGITNAIRQFWGTNSIKIADKAYADGVVEAMAGEVMRGMENIGMFKVDETYIPLGVDEKTGKGFGKSHIRFIPNNPAEPMRSGQIHPLANQFEHLFSYPDALADAVLVKPVRVTHLGSEEALPAPARQMHSDTLNTRKQMSAIENANQIVHRLDLPMLNLYYKLGHDGLKDLFGGGSDVETLPTNVNDKETRVGKNITVGSASSYLEELVSQMQNRSLVTDEHLGDMDIHFEHNMSRVGRAQMLGPNNPQASKVTREVILPTWSTLDLVNNSDHRKAMNLALAQALGIKVETMTPEAAGADVKAKLDGPLAPVLRMLEAHVQEHILAGTLHEAPDSYMLDASKFSNDLLEAVKKSGVKIDPVGLHALLEKARYNLSGPDELEAFRTSLYLEADGKTNGPINAMGMLGNGGFSENWLTNIRKGGFSLGQEGQALHSLGDEAKVDLYSTAAKRAQEHGQALYKKFGVGKSAPYVKTVSDSLLNLMHDFLPGIKKAGDSFELDRTIAKNPLTITLYGSGEKGIAGNISSELLTNISSEMTRALRAIHAASKKGEVLSESEALFPNDPEHAQKFQDLTRNLNNVFSAEIRKNGKTGEFFTNTENLGHKAISQENFSLTDYKASPENFNTLTNNMHQVLVKPLVSAISDTVGADVMEASKVLQTATNKQSMVYVEYIKNAARKALAERAANDPTYRPGDFLSQDAFDKIIKEAAPLAPLVQNADQNVMMTKTGQYTDKKLEYSRTLDDKWGTPPDVAIPGYAGVAGGPFSIISHGDGYMIQMILNGPQRGARMLPVFDGLHMPLDKIAEYGQLANRAAMNAWMNNPMKGVRDSYIKMLDPKNQDMIHRVLADQFTEAKALAAEPENNISIFDAMDKKMVLAKSLLAAIDSRDSIHNYLPEDLHNGLLKHLRTQAENLNLYVASIDARHEVLREVGLSTDQMASAAEPYHNGVSGQVDTSSVKATEADLNALYNGKIKGMIDAQPKIPEVSDHGAFLEHLNESDLGSEVGANSVADVNMDTEAVPDLNQVTDMSYAVDQAKPEPGMQQVKMIHEAPTPTPERETFHALTQQVGRGDNSTGVRILSQTALRKLVRVMSPTDSQRRVLSEIFRSGAAKDYKVISGTPEQVARYSDKIGSGTYADMVGKDGKLNGFISIGEKAIYLVNPSAETLAHELTHAATFETVLAHYNGEELHPETHAAVGRLEDLMNGFIYQELDDNTSPELAQAVQHTLGAINDALFNPDGETAVNKAKALNEFMAWTLSNKALAERLKDQKGQKELAPFNKFTTLAKNVIKEIKNIFWKSMGQRAPKVGDDMLSNIQFNTGILMRDRPLASKMLADATLQHFEQDNDQHISDLRDNFIKNVSRSIEAMPQKDTQQITDKASARESFRLQTTNHEVADYLHSFFPMNMNEATTFKVISAALAFHTHLDPTFVNRAQELYAHVIKHVSVDDFIDPADDPAAASSLANSRYNVIMGRDEFATKYNKLGLSNTMPSFIALAMVNKNFRDVLAKIPAIKPEKSTRESRVDRFVENVFSTAMNKISGWLSGDSHAENVLQSVNALADKINAHATDEATWLQVGAGKINGVSDYINNQMVNALTHLSDKGIALADTVQNSNNSNAAKNAATLLKMLSGHLSEKNGDLAAERLLASVNITGDLPVLNAMKKFTVDLVGRTKANAEVYDMIKQVRSMVAQLRQNYRDKVPEILKSKFSAPPNAEQETHMMYGFGKSDLASLMETHSTKDTLKLLTDPSARAKRAAELEAQIKSADPANWDIYKQKMNQLATFMMGGGPGVNLLRNSIAISRLLGERITDKPELDAVAIRNIDQLTTLYAIDRLGPARHEALASLVQNEPAGTQFMMDYLHGQRKAELDKVGGDALIEHQHYKGHIPSLVEMGSDLKVAHDSQAGEMRLKGFTRVGKYEGSPLEGVREPKSYYFSPVRGRTAFAQGIIQNVDHTTSGVDSVTGFSTHQVAGRILDRTQVTRIAARMQAMSAFARANPDMVDKNTEHLLPLYNANGEVFAFERAMDPKMLAMRNPSTEITKMAGVWQGRQIEEGFANVVNHTLIDHSYDMYKDETNPARPGGSRELEYINVLDPNQTNKIQKDAVRLFNQDTQNYLANKFGEGKFMVRKDLVEDVIGSRHASIGDMWTGNSNWSPQVQHAVRDTMVSLLGPDAYKILVSKEEMIQGVMGDLRRNIAVKMLSIPVMRAVDNVYQLMGRGVPPAAIVRGAAIKMHEISLYNKSREREIEIEAELRASGNDPAETNRLTAEMQAIRDSYQRMSSAPLINKGEFSTINGVGDTTDNVELSSGKIMDWLESKVRQLPPQIRTAARYGILSRDTALYEGLEKLAEYSDFVAKGIYYDHMVKRKGMPPKDALGRISEEYGNFDRSPGRSRAYTDNMGLTWFLNYKIRIAKVALSMMRNNPFHAIVSASAPAFQQTGNVFDDNIFAKIMDGNIRHSIGPAMAAHGLTIGPWYNLAK